MSSEHGLDLRISVTDRCQLACAYCQPGGGCHAVGHVRLSVEDITTFVQGIMSSHGVRKVRITGGEPLLRPDIISIVRALSGLGDFDLGLTTNGQLLAEKAAALKQAGLRRVNVSLDSVQPETFRRLCGGGHLLKTLGGLLEAKAEGLLPIKINTVVMRRFNVDHLPNMLRFSGTNGFEIRFLELMPVGIPESEFRRDHVPVADILSTLRHRFTLTPLPYCVGSTSRRYAWEGEGLSGTFGTIAAVSKPFCSGCRRLRLTSDGSLIGCLAKQDRSDILTPLRGADTAALSVAVDRALSAKQARPVFKGTAQMAIIGG